MDILRQFVTGELGISEFLALFKFDLSVQKQIRQLIPEAARKNRGHSFWKIVCFDTLSALNYDYFQYISATCKLDGTISDNLNLFGPIQRAYSFHYPDVVWTDKYHSAFNMYLDVVGSYLGGPEVENIIDDIIQKALEIKPKNLQKKWAKQMVNSSFHIYNKNYPRWIQDPEWPMGEYVPMQYISSSKHNEFVIYYFRDVDTGKERSIRQYY